MIFKKNITPFLIIGVLLFLCADSVNATNTEVNTDFNIDRGFDASARTQVSATLVKKSNRLDFYIEKFWWDSQAQDSQSKILTNLDDLSNEFDSNIYPTLISAFGHEWSPGIDNDPKITVLLEQMNSAEGGYFREADEYSKLQVPISNEREMVYLSLDKIGSQQIKRALAHEFVHLITFNQKNKVFGLEEDTWLNEARADYSSTILGYDDKYEGSNLQQRVNDFIQNPSDSITEWTGTKYDYASVNLFTHYLVDHYGVNILRDSLKSKYVGIYSINYALQVAGIKDDFGKIFSNWSVALVLNDCSVDQKYCYLNQKLNNLRLAPSLNFLPVAGNVSLSVSNITKNWSGNWLKFIGGNGDLKLDFSGLKECNFQVPYITGNNTGFFSVGSIKLDEEQKGEINIPNFGTEIKSLTIIPSLQTKISGFEGLESAYSFSYAVKVLGKNVADDQILIQRLLDKIALLKSEIAKLQGKNTNQEACSALNNNLSLGMSNNSDVRCLQEFLKNQGFDIYPEGLVTGNFGNLTRKAVIRFQEKYSSEILTPFGIVKGTGYVGKSTREKINQIINGR